MKRITLFISLFSLSIYAIGQTPELTLQSGHNGSIYTFDISNDENILVSAGGDGNIVIWDIESGREIRSIKAHNRLIYSVAISQDGKYIASGSDSEEPKLWDALTGQELYRLGYIEEEYPGINFSTYAAIDFSNDGKTVIAANYGAAETYNVVDGTYEDYQEISSYDICNIQYSNDGNYIIVGSVDKTIKLYNAIDFSLVKEITHNSELSWVSISDDNSYIAATDYNNKIFVWDSKTGEVIKTFEGHNEAIYSVDFSDDGLLLVTASEDSTSVVWDMITGKKLTTFTGHTEMVTKALFIDGGSSVISSSGDASLILWDVNSGKTIKKFEGKTSDILAIDISNNKSFLTTGLNDNKVKIWTLTGYTNVNTIRTKQSLISDICISPDNKSYTIAGQESTVLTLHDLNSGDIIKSFYGHEKDILSVDISKNGRYIVSSDADGEIILWDIKSGDKIKSFNANYGWAGSVKISPDSKFILAGLSREETVMWDILSGEIVLEISQLYSSVYTVDFSHDGKYVASGNFDSQVIIYDTENDNSVINNYHYHSDYISSVAFSPVENIVASADMDKNIFLWDIEKADTICSFPTNKNIVFSLSFSLDGKYLFSSGQNQINIWDVENKKKLARLISFNDSDDWIVSTPDGRFDGTEKGMESLHYVVGNQIIPLESLFENYYTPGLLESVFDATVYNDETLTIKDIGTPPEIKITDPTNGSTQNKSQISVTVEITDKGGGVDEVRIYHNGKLTDATPRGFKPVEKNGSTSTKIFNINLVNGENKIKVKAFNNQRIEGSSKDISIFYRAEELTEPDIYILAIGINEYLNPKYNLNYAKNDADGFVEALKSAGSGIFNNIIVKNIQDKDATKENITNEINDIQKNAKPEDVFVFYYAGHGIMSTGSESRKSDFFLVLHDITQLYEADGQLIDKGISSVDMQDFSKNIKAGKQLFILDACQSGGAIETIAMRGVSEEKALAQLARSAGIFFISSSGTEQFASEVKTIGHGVFTYAVIQVLEGECANDDNTITVNQMKSCVEKLVPELSKQYKSDVQFPTGYGFGQDFPIGIIK